MGVRGDRCVRVRACEASSSDVILWATTQLGPDCCVTWQPKYPTCLTSLSHGIHTPKLRVSSTGCAASVFSHAYLRFLALDATADAQPQHVAVLTTMCHLTLIGNDRVTPPYPKKEQAGARSSGTCRGR